MSDDRTRASFKEAQKFAAYLCTAMLLLTSAPRSQVLSQLQIGSTFSRESSTGQYWIRLKSEQSKHGKPVLLVRNGKHITIRRRDRDTHFCGDETTALIM